MNKSKLTGWKDVFSFTLIQTVKSKSFIVSFMLFFFISIAAMPVISMINGDSDENVCHIEKVYVNDESQLSPDGFLPTIEDELYGNVSFIQMNEDKDALLERIDKEETTSIVLDITQGVNGFNLSFTKPSNGEITKNETKALGSIVMEEFSEYRLNALGISKDQLDFIHSEVDTTVVSADVNGEEIVDVDTSISDAQYWFIYGILFVVMMITTMSGTQIASSIASDKSTRVVEYLLTSVKPLALMFGKILAMLVAVMGQIIVLIIGLFVSNSVTTSITGGESIIDKYLPSGIVSNLSIINIIICFIVIGLGLLFYATLAGIAGATVSKIEELNEGMTMYTVFVMVGAYVGIAAANMLMSSGENSLVTFALIFPLSSPFLLPGAILIGKVNVGLMAISIALLVLFIIMILRFVAKIYETLIYHNGSTVSFKKLIGMAKDLKKGAK
ncbi:MAG: ABC transporter permease [Clostridiales bacterium]|nr:ABC transporter permease [Clostridiales bacterium]